MPTMVKLCGRTGWISGVFGFLRARLSSPPLTCFFFEPIHPPAPQPSLSISCYIFRQKRIFIGLTILCITWEVNTAGSQLGFIYFDFEKLPPSFSKPRPSAHRSVSHGSD
jgi:hypothetical protein